MSESIFFAAREWTLPVALLLALGLWILWRGYRRFPVRGWPRGLSLLLKVTGLVLLGLCLLEPMRTGRSPKAGANDLVVLADNSQGMALGRQAPSEELKKLLGVEQGRSAALEEMDEAFRLQTFLFDRRLQRSADYADLDFTGDRSDLGGALEALRNRYARRPLAGILVFTDGNASDLDELDELASKGALPPVYPVAMGRQGALRDLSLRSVVASETSFEDAPVKLSVEIGHRGFDGERVAIIVSDEEGEELTREIRSLPPKDGETAVVRLRVPGVGPGVSFLSVHALPEALADRWNEADELLEKDSGEVTLDNNRRLATVDRGRGPYRVLYVSGRPNWDYKFMRRAVLADAEIQLVGLVRIARREPKFEWRGREGETSNPLFRGFGSKDPAEVLRYDQPVIMRLNTRDAAELRDGFPKTDEALFGNYRAVILDDVEASFFSAEQQQLLERFVSFRGGSLMMMGGQESFQEGGYPDTPVADVLPVYLDRKAPGAPALDTRLALTREGMLEPWMRLAVESEAEELRLAHMPSFWAVNRLLAIKPGASILATVTDSEQRQYPALATQRFGEGRAAAFPVADVWRWGLRDAEAREQSEQALRQLVRWLVSDVPDPRGEVETRRERRGASEAVLFKVTVRDEGFRPQPEASVAIKVQGPGEDEVQEVFAEPSLEEAGVFEAEVFAEDAGAYRAEVTIRDPEGLLLAEKEAGWAMNPAADELARIGLNREPLERLAAASGGRVLDSSDLASFVRNELPDLDAPVMATWTRPLWHAPIWFTLALACFLAEWCLRRWKGIL